MAPLLAFGALPLDRAWVTGFALPDEYGFASVNRIEGLPVIQRTANPARSGTIAGRLHEALVDVDRQIFLLRQAAAAKAAQLLIWVATGRPVGWFVINRLNARPLLVAPSGGWRAADLTLSIQEFPADRAPRGATPPALAARRATREARPDAAPEAGLDREALLR